MEINNERIYLLGCPIDNLSLKEAIFAIEEFIRSKKPHQCICINADKIVRMKKSDFFQNIIAKSDLNIVDGQPLMWIAKLFGKNLKERYGGLEIINATIPLAEKKGYGVYLLGAQEEVVEKVVDIFRSLYPNLKLVGWRNGYWKQDEERKLIENIKEKHPDILFLAMSSPKKEAFINKYFEELNIPFSMGVGGAFDIIAGKVKRAPKWVQKCGMEWFFRVINEPRRLFKRYLVGNLAFTWIVFSEFLNLKVKKPIK